MHFCCPRELSHSAQSRLTLLPCKCDFLHKPHSSVMVERNVFIQVYTPACSWCMMLQTARHSCACGGRATPIFGIAQPIPQSIGMTAVSVGPSQTQACAARSDDHAVCHGIIRSSSLSTKHLQLANVVHILCTFV